MGLSVLAHTARDGQQIATAARRRERHEWQWKRRDADRRVKLQHILPKMQQTRSSDRAWGTGR